MAVVADQARRLWRRHHRHIDFEELRGLGLVALLAVLERFDPERGAFEPFVRRRVRGAMLDEIRKRSRRRLKRLPVGAAEGCVETRRRAPERTRERAGLVLLVAEPGTISPSSEIDNLAVAGAHDPEHELLVRRRDDRVREAIAELPPGPRRVVERHYLHGESLATLADGMGVSRHAVGRMHRRGLARLKRRLAEDCA
ncbi:MAG: sigma-70 family RNA polymerase sigma factor [Myxococcales bacterium]|nr:sigma-70 family RNA polymerase sigma factor [Myxococcales bacterium]